MTQQTNPALSTLCILGGMFLIGVIDNLILFVSDLSSLWLFHTSRSVLAMAILGALALLGLSSLRAKRPSMVILRNMFNANALLIYFGCLAILPVGVVVSGLFTAPLFVLVLSVLFRGLSVGPWRWGAVLIGFAGAVLIVWPEEGGLTWLSLLPILAGLCYAISAIGTRAWCEGESATVMTFSYFAIIGLYGLIGLTFLTLWPIEAPAGPDGWVSRGYIQPDATFGWVVLAQTLGSVAGVWLLTKGYQLGEASYVAIIEYSLIVFASVVAWILWDQVLGPWALVGIGLIILSGSIIALRSS